MTEESHRFRVGQTVSLVQWSSRSETAGQYQIVSLRPADGDVPHYRIKSRSETYERVVAESDLVLSAHLGSIDRERR